MRVVLAIAVALWLIVAVSATGHPGSYGFPITSLLQCHIQNPFYTHYSGQPASIPESIPIIPFHNNGSGLPYLPVESGFERPPGRFPEDILFGFVGNLLEVQLSSSSATRPVIPARIANAFLPINLNTASGGDGVGEDVAGVPDYGSMINDTLNALTIGELPGFNPVITTDAERQLIIDAVNFLTRTRCRVVADWVRLPDTYWPPWFSANFCSGETCSIPDGLRCEPIISDRTLLYIIVLRWDCCWSFRDAQWRWECGWRKVRIPLISRCRCGCGPIFEGDGFSAVLGRLNGEITLAVPNLIPQNF